MKTHQVRDTYNVSSRSLEGVGLFYGRFAGALAGSFVPDCYVIWQLLDGGNDEWYRGKVHQVQPGLAHVAQPGEPFIAIRRTSSTTEDLSVHLSSRELLRAVSALRGREVDAHDFSRFQFSVPGVASAARALAGAVLDDADALELQSRILGLVSLLLAEDGTPQDVTLRRRDLGRTRAIRDYLEDRCTDSVSLDELELTFGVTRFHLVRAFKDAYGIPPHQYLTHLRVTRAQTLLRRGFPLAQLAAEVGFSDQSHLYRHFKRLVAMTPGEYARRVDRRDRISFPRES